MAKSPISWGTSKSQFLGPIKVELTLVEQNRQGRNDANVLTSQERSANRQAISEIVGKISRQIQPRGHGELLFWLLFSFKNYSI